jgi:hypothetical protein
MNCLICGSSNIETIDTIVSDFVMARINDKFKTGNNYKTKLCFCRDCTFAFYDYRFDKEEEYKLYKNYRDVVYQKTREFYECWYTKKVNEILNSDEIELKDQQNQILAMLFNYTDKEIKVALDYGGNEGKTFVDEIGTVNKYVFDISGVEPISGVVKISNQLDLKRYKYDFIMSNMLFEHLSYPLIEMKQLWNLGDKDTLFYIEVPSENPFIKGNKFSLSKNIKLAINPSYDFIKLVKYYIKTIKGPFMPMKEHINFFTEKSLKKMLEISQFKEIAICETKRNSKLGTGAALSVLFKKN